MSTNSSVPWTNLSDVDKGIDSAILLRAEDVTEETMNHIKAMSGRPDVQHARFMPDCHPVKHAIVGQTSQLLYDKVDPATVGGDIGCGISAQCVGVSTGKMRLEKIKAQIEARIPKGTLSDSIFPPGQAYATDKDISEMLDAYSTSLEQLCTNYQKHFGINLHQHIHIPTHEELMTNPTFWFKTRCIALKQNYDEAIRSLCTLGGGNHYIEVSRDSKNQIWVVVHTGSRGPGQAVFRAHRNVLLRSQDFDRTGHLKAQRMIEKRFPIKKSVERCEALEALRQEYTKTNKTYLEGVEAYAYYLDLLLMQTYAQWNRKLITRRIVTEVLGCVYNNNEEQDEEHLFVESVHNLIDFNDFIIRKGAIASYTHIRSIVAINMAQGCWIVRARCNDTNTNYSAPHGLGRNQERGTITTNHSLRERLSQFRKQMGDIVADITPHTLDESPFAYKPPELVLESISHHVTIEDQLIPLINIKG